MVVMIWIPISSTNTSICNLASIKQIQYSVIIVFNVDVTR